MTAIPPPQFDYPPHIPVIEWVRPRDYVSDWCSKQGGSVPGGYNGCAVLYRGKCYIVRIDSADTARHERAHCNGWPANHPGRR